MLMNSSWQGTSTALLGYYYSGLLHSLCRLEAPTTRGNNHSRHSLRTSCPDTDHAWPYRRAKSTTPMSHSDTWRAHHFRLRSASTSLACTYRGENLSTDAMPLSTITPLLCNREEFDCVQKPWFSSRKKSTKQPRKSLTHLGNRFQPSGMEHEPESSSPILG